jgi:ABC-type transport system substrate-binding protein
VQEQWAQIGVSMSPLQVSSANWLSRNLHERKFDMITNNATWGGFDQDPTRIISSAAAAPGGQNASGYTSTEIDRLCAEGSGSTVRATRKAAYSKLQTLFMTELPQLPLILAPNLYGVNKRMQNVTIGSWTQLTNWYWMTKASVSSGK